MLDIRIEKEAPIRNRQRGLAVAAGAFLIATAFLLVDPVSGDGGPQDACAVSACIQECACIWGPNTNEWYCESWDDANQCSSDSDCRD